MADFSGHKQAMRKADEAYRQSLLPLLFTPPLVTLNAYAPTVINPKEDKCRGAINYFPLEVFFKDDTDVTIYDKSCEIVCRVKGSTLRDRIFDPINGRLNRVIVTDGV